nr:hypothetical protein [Tanacetum cinerariifolium]
EESSTPLRDIIISELPLCISITLVLSTEEPKDSLIMGDEHLDTILEKESDEFIKSSVENLVPNPSESEELSNIKKSLLNQDSLIISSPKIDSLLEEFSGELAHINLLPPGINEADFDSEEEIRLIFLSTPILVEDSDSLMEEIDLFLSLDDSMPPGIKNDYYDSEGDIIFLEEFLSNDSPSLLENKSFYLDVLSSPRPPAKLPDDDGIFFDDEPDTGLLTVKVVGDIYKHYVHVPNVLPTQPTLCLVIDTLLSFSFEIKDKVYLLSHWGFKAFKFFLKAR